MPGFDPWIGKITWRKKWQCIPVFLPGEFHEQKSLTSYSPWGCKESDMTKWLTLVILGETIGIIQILSFLSVTFPL